MKKIVTLLLLGILVFSCGKTESPDKKDGSDKTEMPKKEKIVTSIPPLRKSQEMILKLFLSYSLI